MSPFLSFCLQIQIKVRRASLSTKYQLLKLKSIHGSNKIGKCCLPKDLLICNLTFRMLFASIYGAILGTSHTIQLLLRRKSIHLTKKFSWRSFGVCCLFSTCRSIEEKCTTFTKQADDEYSTDSKQIKS